ncbi:efflux RND transporter periplasmic adaptor subunit [Oceanospirillum sanctuarii]|uniref:efflux RND transporter periplasmic adaptor subunit n=1 Tax=Oceanospirillum sanctuarii TaxID=1434821 RepID=UPI000A37E720|nr:efflux RND transporter periplasmic adaptor subunit [Oceanospirillum sanctuarii]
MRYLFFLLFILPSLAVADEFYGVIYSDSKIEQSMEDSGTVKSIDIKIGQDVKAGEILVTLESGMQELEQQRNRLIWKDTRELETQLRRLDILRNKRDVAESLYSQTRSISRDELDSLSLELIQVEGRIEQIKEQKLRDEIEYHLSSLRLQKRQLRAAFDGTVISLTAKQGEWVKAGDPILGLVNADNLYINLNVPDIFARRLSLNSSVPISVQNVSAVHGRVDFISPVADAASGLVEIRIKLKNENKQIRPGAKAMVTL